MLWHSLPAIVAMAARLDAYGTPTGFYAVFYRVGDTLVGAVCVIAHGCSRYPSILRSNFSSILSSLWNTALILESNSSRLM